MSKSSKTSNNQKITLNVEIKNINEETKKAEKLIELLNRATMVIKGVEND